MNRGADKFQFVLDSFYSTPWAIVPSKLHEIEALMWARIRNGRGSDFVAAEPSVRRSYGDQFQRVEDVAVIPITGIITQRPSVMTSGGTSTMEIAGSLNAALNDQQISKILLLVDSPGGSVYGVAELGSKLAAARERKPITAVADSVAASAAYWLASQANELVVTTGGEVGSIGVVAAHVDQSRAEEIAGFKTTVVTSTKSPHKAEFDPSQPLSNEARSELQSSLDKYYRMFASAVASGRGVTTARVERDFGGGRMLMAQDALRAGMVDRIAPADEVLSGMIRKGGGGRHRAAAATTAPTVAAQLRNIAVMAVQAGVAVPTSTDPTTARKQLARNVTAKLMTDEANETTPTPAVRPRQRVRATTREERNARVREIEESMS